MATPLPPSSAHGIMSQALFASGTLTGTTATYSMLGAPLPATVVLNSTDPSREIAYSFDNGATWFAPSAGHYTESAANQIVLGLDYSVTNVRFTGVATNTWSIF